MNRRLVRGCVAAAAAAALAGSGAALAVRVSPPPASVRRWQADIAYLARELPRVHAAGMGASRARWAAAAARLESEVPRLTRGQIIVGMAHLVTMLRDDETQLTFPLSPGYPIALQFIGNGLYALGLPSAQRALLGAELLAINGHPVSAVLARLGSVIDYEDAGVARFTELGLLTDADLLQWLGLARSSATAAFTLRTVAGSTVTVRLRAGRRVPGAQVPRPFFLNHGASPYWMQVLGPQRAVYLKYNQCLDGDGFGRLAAAALRALRARPGYRLIIDLRDNFGGDDFPFRALITGIRADPAVNRRGLVFGLVNGFTDSSARLDAQYLRQGTEAILIGQPVADPIDRFGDDGNVLTLPYYGVRIQYTTKVLGPPVLGPPDVVVAPTLRDWLTGMDPVLAAALSYPRGQ